MSIIEKALKKYDIDRKCAVIICILNDEILIKEYFPDEPCKVCCHIGGWTAIMSAVALCDSCILNRYSFVAVIPKNTMCVVKS